MSKISSYWIKHQLWQCYARKPSLSRAQWVRKLVPVLLEGLYRNCLIRHLQVNACG